MIYFPINFKLTAKETKALLEEDNNISYYKHHGKSGYHHLDFGKPREELTNKIIKFFPEANKVTLTAIEENETVPLHTDGNYGRKTVIILPLSNNYAPCIADNTEIPYMHCYAFNTQVPHTVINNNHRRVSLQLWYNMDIEQLYSIMGNVLNGYAYRDPI
jgi:hypothetical protein